MRLPITVTVNGRGYRKEVEPRLRTLGFGERVRGMVPPRPIGVELLPGRAGCALGFLGRRAAKRLPHVDEVTGAENLRQRFLKLRRSGSELIYPGFCAEAEPPEPGVSPGGQ